MSFQKKKKKNKKKIDKQITNVYCISCNITNKQTRHKIYFTENEIIPARIMRSSYKFPFLEICVTLYHIFTEKQNFLFWICVMLRDTAILANKQLAIYYGGGGNFLPVKFSNFHVLIIF